MATAHATHPASLAPDLAHLPITRDPRAFSLIEGVRAALSVAVIIAVSEYFEMPILRESALAALWACLCDPGGPIRRRVPVLLSFTIIGALITGGFGVIRGLGPAAALPAGVAALFAAAFVRVYGQSHQVVGTMLGMATILALDRGLSVREAVDTGAAFGFGALWATLLTLAIWRLHPYRAARQAVANVYRALGALAGDLHRLLCLDTVDDAKWEEHARSRRRAVREAIEVARDAALGTLRSRGAFSLRASQTLIRLETGDQIFGALIALSEILEHGSDARRRTAKRLSRPLRPLLNAFATAAETDARFVRPGVGRAIDAIEAAIAGLSPADPLRPVADTLIERLRVAQTLAVPANFVPGADPAGRRIAWWRLVLRPIKANLTWQSPMTRYAARVTAVASLALVGTMVWFTPYDHWLTITIFGTMQPFFAVTYTRALERVIGTVLGGLIAALVGMLCTTPLSIAMAMFPLVSAALAVRAVNFGLYMMALTPVVVLLVETGQPGAEGWHIAVARAALTIAGGLASVAGGFFLWPARMPGHLIEGTRTAIAAHARYADAEFALVSREVTEAEVNLARRDAGIANNNLEAAINRALIERGGDRDLLEAVLVIDAALRRVAGQLSAMHLDPAMGAAPMRTLAAWRDWIGASLRALASEVVDLPPRPDFDAPGPPRRIARQIELIAGAMRRLPLA